MKFVQESRNSYIQVLKGSVDRNIEEDSKLAKGNEAAGLDEQGNKEVVHGVTDVEKLHLLEKCTVGWCKHYSSVNEIAKQLGRWEFRNFLQEEHLERRCWFISIMYISSNHREARVGRDQHSV